MLATSNDRILQANRRLVRQTINQLLTGDPSKDEQVRHVQKKAFGLPGTDPLIGTGSHPIELDEKGNIIPNFILCPSNTGQMTSVITSVGTAGAEFVHFLRKFLSAAFVGILQVDLVRLAGNTGRFLPGADKHDLTVRPFYQHIAGILPAANAATAFLWLNAVSRWTNLSTLAFPGTSYAPSPPPN